MAFLSEGDDSVIKLSPPWKRRKTRLVALAGLRRSISRKTALAGLVSAATVTTLALSSAAFAGSPVTSAPGSVRVATQARAEVRVADPAPAKVSVPAPVRAAMQTLTGVGFYYSQSSGFQETFWRQAVATSAMEAYRQTTGDTTYDYTLADLDKPASDFEDSLNDDTAWWGLALLQGYSITHDPLYLRNAEEIADYIGKTWNTNPMACFAGGIPWERSGPQFGYTGAIQNGLFLELTAWLHNTIVENGGSDSGPNSYLSWAVKEWNYFQRTGLFHTDAITVPRGFGGPSVLEPYVVPNATPDLPQVASTNALCGSIRYRIYTYNQGVLIGGLVQLYKAMNNDSTYLTDAEDIANAVLKPPTPAQSEYAKNAFRTGKSPWIFTVNGVLIEPQDNPAFSPACCLGDGAAFKGIFVRDLRMLDDTVATAAKTDKKANQCTAAYHDKSYNQCTTMYNDFFTTQACSIEANDTSSVNVNSIGPGGQNVQQYSFLGDHWTGPNAPQDVTTQVSAVEALVAAVNLPGQSPGSYPDCQPRRGSSADVGQPGQQGQPSDAVQAVQAVERCQVGWYRMPDCWEEHDFGRYLVPVRRGHFFQARHQQFSREGDREQDD